MLEFYNPISQKTIDSAVFSCSNTSFPTFAVRSVNCSSLADYASDFTENHSSNERNMKQYPVAVLR
jgi:hypothetical protein